MGNAKGYKEWITAKYFVAISAKDCYSINGEINKKIALKIGRFKCDVLDAVIVLGKGSLLYQTLGVYVCSIYIFMYKWDCLRLLILQTSLPLHSSDYPAAAFDRLPHHYFW